jgi:hypothetical protein
VTERQRMLDDALSSVEHAVDAHADAAHKIVARLSAGTANQGPIASPCCA